MEMDAPEEAKFMKNSTVTGEKYTNMLYIKNITMNLWVLFVIKKYDII